ncbi:MAG: 2-dehydro-3-deoxy-6-phosphogalactonate aldolase, partial [Asticcacaulis sp.]
MTLMQRWQGILAELPLVAILRGLRPDEAVDVGEALIAAGFKVVEVPLNSPQPFVSIERLVTALGERAIVGAGTVLTLDDVQKLSDAGGQICISPNTNVEVIRFAKALGQISFPAFFTATEAFQAIAAGADALKLFPAELAGPKGLKALKAV